VLKTCLSFRKAPNHFHRKIKGTSRNCGHFNAAMQHFTTLFGQDGQALKRRAFSTQQEFPQ
jgi:hypothetical protein